MFLALYILVLLIFVTLLNIFLIKNKILVNLTGDFHQKFTSRKKIPLTGGILLFLSSLFFFDQINKFFYLSIFSIFLLGFFSDLKIIISPRLRFVLQILFIFLFVFYHDLQISNVRISFIDQLLEYKNFSYVFVIFCILIVVNGTNFIDGLNGLVLGYFFIILLTLYNLDLLQNTNISKTELEYFLIFLFYLLLFNLFNKLYIGDSGSYFLGFVFGALLIFIYKNNENISPFFIVLLLWYPCFENLFSIIRKLRFNLSPLVSDNKHFHQLLFYFFKKKINLSNLTSNNLSSLLINFFNLSIILMGSSNIYNSQLQIGLIILNILIYIFIYIRLFDFRFKKKLNKN